MDKLNIKCPVQTEPFLNVGASPEKIGIKKLQNFARVKHSQSTPQLRGLLEKVKEISIQDLSYNPLLKLNSKKLGDITSMK